MTEIDDAWPPTAADLADAIRRGERSARWATEQALAAVAARNDGLGAFVALDPDGALAAADAVDAAVVEGVGVALHHLVEPDEDRVEVLALGCEVDNHDAERLKPIA